jgi:hypothetical protein
MSKSVVKEIIQRNLRGPQVVLIDMSSLKDVPTENFFF